LHLPTSQWGRHRDSAFAFRDEYSLTDEGQAVVNEFDEWLSASQGSGRKIVGICPSSVVYSKSVKAKKDYLASLSDILIGALRSGHRVAVIPNATREGRDTLRNNDLPVIRMLRERVRREAPPALADAVFWTDSDINTARLRRIIRRFDLLLTSRFHAMIAALSQEVPTVVIGWSHKYQEVLVDFSLENCCFDYAAEHIGEIQTRIAEILDPAFRSGWPPPGRTSSIVQSARDQFELAVGPDPGVSGEPDTV
jgi:hypothetical protein